MQVESYLLHAAAESREVQEIILSYPPALARGAKRMINHARLLTRIARERDVFGGAPEVTPAHLGKWIVLSERWPQLADRVLGDPNVMTELETRMKDSGVAAALATLEIPVTASDELDRLVRTEPTLGPVIERLVRFEPATLASSPAVSHVST